MLIKNNVLLLPCAYAVVAIAAFFSTHFKGQKNVPKYKNCGLNLSTRWNKFLPNSLYAPITSSLSNGFVRWCRLFFRRKNTSKFTCQRFFFVPLLFRLFHFFLIVNLMPHFAICVFFSFVGYSILEDFLVMEGASVFFALHHTISLYT